MVRLRPLILLAALAAAGAGGGSDPRTPARREEPVRFDRDVRPILADRCFKCHGSDAKAREADLRLDLREDATRAREGTAAIVPGDPDKSEMWRRITSDDPDLVMPRPASRKPRLSEAERAIIRKWIEEGAAYEPHWAFVPPKRPSVPEVSNPAWCRNGIDRFVLARLEREGLAPSAEASKDVLLRRVFLDLTGLPPTPEETDAFAADERPDAYERLVSRLLRDEPYRSRHAERMATPWLDAARYGDTCGLHTDDGRSIWPWRDWVLRAFRDDMRFDAFLTEQLAGDLVPGASRDQIVASGFNRNHVTTDEGGALPEEYLVEYAIDRVATTGSAFLGLTIGCARCHDHKFDPISQEDFYRLFSFFNSIDEPGKYSQILDPKRAHEPNLAVPSAEQEQELARLRVELAKREADADRPVPGEASKRDADLAEIASKHHVSWESVRVESATSTGGATLVNQADGSILATGTNPDEDEYAITVALAQPARMLLLEALPDPSLPGGRVGRGFNGNAVLTNITAEARSRAHPEERRRVRFAWAWADHEQGGGDFGVLNALDAPDARGWGVAGHQKPGGRVVLFVADDEFGFEGGTLLEVRLSFNSGHQQHALGRVRLRAGRIDAAGVHRLPVAQGEWYRVGPFPADGGDAAYKTTFEPEGATSIDLKHNFGFGNQTWVHARGFADGKVHALPEGTHALYLARRVFSPSPRKLELSLGSDDGIRVFEDGREIFGHQIERTAKPDQDHATLDLGKGPGTIVLKIVNTGGESGFYYRAVRPEGEIAGALTIALLPEAARSEEMRARLERAWRVEFSPTHRAAHERVVEVAAKIAKIESEIPMTMVMRELTKPREAFVLVRGQYDRPDRSRPVGRGVPAALGVLPEGAPANRLGLARWMTSASNPLVARVAVNRLWATVFGAGIVRTSDDFGNQGEWPSHPELIDWLAVEFREGGWNVRTMIERIVTSATYRQQSIVRAEVRNRDPDDRLLAYFPRRRLSGEMIRDQALFVSGLLVEQFGGPPVKPYQPPGLWEEVAMPASNTRIFKRDDGPALWRRSVYTYWKRASPPPSMLLFDAPTRESCVVRRSMTNTPLQALALWNDEQFVEAARVLAQRTLAEGGDDGARVARMFRRCTGREPDQDAVATLTRALAAFRERYLEAPADAGKVVAIGTASRPAEPGAAEIAAWTLVASAVLDLDATTSRN
jgi:Protein of unknown function (DUF1553)/Protein of unknown function (DUF1549)/Planctomycete cytochrome C